MRVPQQLAPVHSAAFETPPLPCQTRADKATRRTGPRSHATKQTKEAMPAHLGCAEPHQPISCPPSKRVDQTNRRRGVDVRPIILVLDAKASVRCQPQSESGHAAILKSVSDLV